MLSGSVGDAILGQWRVGISSGGEVVMAVQVQAMFRG